MAKPFGGKRPQDLRHTLRRFMDYLGRHKIMLGVVGLLAAVRDRKSTRLNSSHRT